MGKIVWNKVGAKRYEDGVDRAVLYLADGSGVPWNGLTGVDEDVSDIESTAYYYDGTKYLDTRYPGDFSATMRAFMYPDEFLQFDGYTELNNGVLLGNQPVYDRFGLSYRTKIGNDVDGFDHGYKIHILYNLVATPTTRAYKTLQGQQDMNEFGWKISGVPEQIAGHRPTVHIILDTTRMNPFLIRDVERILYGTDPVVHNPGDPGDPGDPGTPLEDVIDGGTSSDPGEGYLDGGTSSDPGIGIVDGNPSIRVIAELAAGVPVPDDIPGTPPHLPPLQELVDLLNGWVLIDVVDNGDGTWTATGPDEFVKNLPDDMFQITSGSAVVIDEDTYELTTTSSF